MSEEELKIVEIKDKIIVITWQRNIIGKHHHIEIVQAKANNMLQHVNSFKYLFTELFQKGLPSFWDEHGKLISQSEYQDLLVKATLDHRKFKDMTQSLTGKAIIDKLVVYFEILDLFRIIGGKVTPIYYVDHLELGL